MLEDCIFTQRGSAALSSRKARGPFYFRLNGSASCATKPPLTGSSCGLFLRPPFEHPRPLPRGYSGARAYPDVVGEDGARFVEVTAGTQHAGDALFVPGPKLDLVEVAIVRNQRVVGFFVGPVAHSIVQGGEGRDRDRRGAQGLA